MVFMKGKHQSFLIKICRKKSFSYKTCNINQTAEWYWFAAKNISFSLFPRSIMMLKRQARPSITSSRSLSWFVFTYTDDLNTRVFKYCFTNQWWRFSLKLFVLQRQASIIYKAFNILPKNLLNHLSHIISVKDMFNNQQQNIGIVKRDKELFRSRHTPRKAKRSFVW